MTDAKPNKHCPCGSGKALRLCCQPFFEDLTAVPSAEHLMRARFSAYLLGHQGHFLVQSWHPDQRAGLLASELDTVTHRWKNLTVLEHVAAGDRSEVTFLAFYETPDGLEVMHERARFVRENNHWYYVDGQQFDTRVPSRKTPCLCGSGKPFKRCCGA